MRTADASSYGNLIANLGRLSQRLQEVNEEISSGSKLNHLRNAPASSSEMVQIQSNLDRIDQYETNAGQADYFLKVSESALSSVFNLVSSIYANGSEAASDTTDENARATLAEEIRSQRDQILSLANTKIRGRYIFSGSQTDTAAYELNGNSAEYHGDNVVNSIEISNNLQVKANVPGSDAFKEIFNGIEQLLTATDANDVSGIKTALSQFSDGMSTLSRVRASLGVDLAKVEDSASARDSQQTFIQERQSQIGDADIAEAIVRLSQTQTAYQAALSAGSNINQINLFDFLG
jgi:flagellar hook-associated protein 3 FlgL